MAAKPTPTPPLIPADRPPATAPPTGPIARKPPPRPCRKAPAASAPMPGGRGGCRGGRGGADGAGGRGGRGGEPGGVGEAGGERLPNPRPVTYSNARRCCRARAPASGCIFAQSISKNPAPCCPVAFIRRFSSPLTLRRLSKLTSTRFRSSTVAFVTGSNLTLFAAATAWPARLSCSTSFWIAACTSPVCRSAEMGIETRPDINQFLQIMRVPIAVTLARRSNSWSACCSTSSPQRNGDGSRPVIAQASCRSAIASRTAATNCAAGNPTNARASSTPKCSTDRPASIAEIRALSMAIRHAAVLPSALAACSRRGMLPCSRRRPQRGRGATVARYNLPDTAARDRDRGGHLTIRYGPGHPPRGFGTKPQPHLRGTESDGRSSALAGLSLPSAFGRWSVRIPAHVARVGVL